MLFHDENTQNFVHASFLIGAGVGLLIAGQFADPRGEIHPSVLAAFGEILCFVACLKGIRYHKNKS